MKVIRSNVALLEESIERLDSLAQSSGVSRNKFFECVSLMTEAQAKAIVKAHLSAVDAAYKEKNQKATAERRAGRELLSKLSEKEIKAIMKR